MRMKVFIALGMLLLMSRALALPVGDVKTLFDWSDLPVLDGGHLQEATNWRGPKPNQLTDFAPGQTLLLEDKQGPGCIARVSISAVKGTLKVYCDGATTPQIAVPLEQLYLSYPYWDAEKMQVLDTAVPQTFPFLIPLSSCAPGYKNACYLPIPYAKSVRVVFEHDVNYPWVSYSVLYRRYPANTPVNTFDMTALAQHRADVQAAADAWRHMGARPSSMPGDQVTTGHLQLPPRAGADIYTATGSGSIVGLRLRAQPWHIAVDRLLVLRASWDGEKRPSVEVPIGDFCASSDGFRQTRCLPVGGGGKDGWYWCYLPMPYSAGARLSLENLSAHVIPNLEYEITVRPGPIPNGAGRFCARWKRADLPADGIYELLNATGAGKLIGYNLSIRGFAVPAQFSARKTHMLLYRDGETDAGVGDAALMQYYYSGGYSGPNWDSPLSAIPVLDFATIGAYADYRYFLTDAPDWTKSARLVLDVAKDDKPGKDYSSTVYWYREPTGTETFAPLTHDALLLPTPHEPEAIEIEDLLNTATVSGGDLLVVDDPEERFLVSGNKYASFAPLGFGERLTVRVPVKDAGQYTLYVRPIVGPSGGLWDVSVNGSPTPGPKESQMFACMDTETHIQWLYPNGWLPVGKFTFVAGDNSVAFVSHPSYAGLSQRGTLLTLDAIRLTPVK